MNPRVPLLGWLILVVIPACSGSSTFQGECKRDSDCKDYERCDTMDFRCVCDSDQACAEGEYCNPSGSCQRKTGCLSNLDCDGAVCDVASGECISAGSCADDIHCDIGQICQNGACRLGCRDTSDCDLGALEVCVDGSCRFGLCENNQYCEYGRVCDVGTKACVQPSDPFCAAGCSPICETCTDKTQGPCGDPANLCFDGGVAGTFCWVACQEDNECPAGYQCLPSSVDWGPVCDEDADCATVTNTCGSMSHRCALNQQPCDTTADCLVFTVICELSNCVIGQHCRPVDGCP